VRPYAEDVTRVSQRVNEIIHHEAEADRLTAEASEHRWEAARLIVEELVTGKTQRQLAQEIGKSHVHVGAMARVWRTHGGNHDYQQAASFNQLYRIATGQMSQDGKRPNFKPDDGEQPRLDRLGPFTCPNCACTWRVGPGGTVEVISQ
jgi:hypothetical protein